MNWVRENLEKLESFKGFSLYLPLIEDNVKINPTLCVESCKALLEGICKTILTNKGVEISSSIKFHSLVRDTVVSILSKHDGSNEDAADLSSRIAAVAHKLGEIRNTKGFVSHGMDIHAPKVSEPLSRLAMKITDTTAGFILDLYANNRDNDQRVHYEENQDFNDYFDELYPLNAGDVPLSASEALFQQDPQGYRAERLKYLETLLASKLDESELGQSEP